MRVITLLLIGISLLNLFCANPIASAKQRTYRLALPGYKFSFPRDHASHDEFKTEWWYYTGHLKTNDGRTFGYELTFFRTGSDELNTAENTPWTLRNYYLAHFAVTDENGKKFKYFEKLNRAGLNVAGAREDSCVVFNEGWVAELLGGRFYIKAEAGDYGIHLILDALKPPVVHGQDGVSQKASGRGNASHYYSMTRLKTSGLLFENGKPLEVTGLTWMDHEFGSNQLTKDQVGWDWYSVQLNNNCELMLYQMRRSDGTLDPNSSGTFIAADGSTKKLKLADFSTKAAGKWKSPTTGGTYPMGWNLSVPSLNLNLELKPTLENQELATKKSTGVSYWEGSVKVEGKMGSKQVAGSGYVEMTGYAEKFRKNI